MSNGIARREFLRHGLAAGSASLLAGVPTPALAAPKGGGQPNIVLIYADDLGYGDVGYHGCKDVPTPHIDSIARAGVWFPAGYVTAAVCAPSRAGLLTGQYQQRFGFEDNVGPFRQRPTVERGTPLDRLNLAERLKQLGYATSMVGKWHEGEKEKFQPPNRGFDEYFGFNNGAARYFIKGNDNGRLRRGMEVVDREDEYLTDAFGREAVSFIERQREKPFFLYVPFNAIHGPLQAPEAEIARFPGIVSKKRRTMAAMLASMDRNIGRILQALRKRGIEEDTLVIFLSDNGGKPEDARGHGNASVNTPLRGTKGQYYEGGIRIPFCLQWKAKLPAGQRYDRPVISLDIVPTCLVAAGADIDAAWNLDGINLLPCVGREQREAPRRYLYWRQLYNWAIRDEEWKLVKMRHEKQAQLFHLSEDISESRDLAAERPEIVTRLRAAHAAWAKGVMEPQWGWQPGICGQKYGDDLKPRRRPGAKK